VSRKAIRGVDFAIVKGVRSIGNLASVDNLGILIFKDAIFDERSCRKRGAGG
jgi:hypothetical protein